MAYFDGLTASITQTGLDGRTYYAPVGRYGSLHLVPDEVALTALRRDWRRFFIASFAVMMGVIMFAGPAWLVRAGWKFLLIAPLIAGLIAIGYGLILARRLPRAGITHDQLVRVNPAQAQERVRAAMGPKTWRLVVGCSILMSVVCVAVAINTPTLTLWFGAVFFVACTVSFLWRHKARRP